VASCLGGAFELFEVWLTERDDPAVLADVDLVVMGPGDPFHLLDLLRATGWDRAVAAAVAGGLPYVGISAGTLVAGPSLAPCTLSSPFAPRPGLDLTALGLVDRVVLPHHDLPGRAARHGEAVARFGDEVDIVTLDDERALLVSGGTTEVVASRSRGFP
jgi:dipeptidase E